MSQWKNTDDAANSVFWAVEQYKVRANTTTQAEFYGNTTADAYITGITVGQFAVDDNEIKADGGKVAHTGWVVRTVGSGGRAGRVQSEVLVAGGITTDGEDTVYPDYAITITTQPLANSANATSTATFRVIATSTPSTTLSYQWTYANGTTLATGANVGTTTTANLVVNTQVVSVNTSFKVAISATGATTVTSSNATLTITA